MSKQFDAAEALQIIERLRALFNEYYGLTGRALNDDEDLLERLESLEEMGDLTEGTTAADAMAAFYRADKRISYTGDDDHWNEAMYFAFGDEVYDAVDALGLKRPAEEE